MNKFIAYILSLRAEDKVSLTQELRHGFHIFNNTKYMKELYLPYLYSLSF